MPLNRADLERAIREGKTVLVNGQPVNKGNLNELPPDRPGSPVEGVVSRDAQGRLTREGMEATVRAGGSVMVGDRFVSDLAGLPSAADLALGDEQATRAERERLHGLIAAHQAELSKLDRTRAQETAPPAQDIERQRQAVKGLEAAQERAAEKEAAPTAEAEKQPQRAAQPAEWQQGKADHAQHRGDQGKGHKGK